MSSEGTLAVSAAVVALTQVFKWAGIPDRWGPILVILLSGLGVAVWVVSGDSYPPQRGDIWSIATGWINIVLTAAGAFGFTRATAGAVTRITSPPADGAGSSATGAAAGAPDPDVLADAVLVRIRQAMSESRNLPTLETTPRIPAPDARGSYH